MPPQVDLGGREDRNVGSRPCPSLLRGQRSFLLVAGSSLVAWTEVQKEAPSPCEEGKSTLLTKRMGAIPSYLPPCHILRTGAS